jgi:hypothetical protein
MGTDTDADDQPAETGEVSRTFLLGLIVVGVLLFGLFVWFTLTSGGATPL